MTKRRFIVPGEPKGKMRPRSSAFGGHSRIYAPSQQIEYENWIRSCYMDKYEGEPFLKGPLRVSVEVYVGIPKSASKKNKALMLNGTVVPTKKPDLDNVIKQLDALNGIAFEDDASIVEISAFKIYSETPRVVFELGEVDEAQ